MIIGIVIKSAFAIVNLKMLSDLVDATEFFFFPCRRYNLLL